MPKRKVKVPKARTPLSRKPKTPKQGTRKCGRCGQTQAISEFTRKRGGKDSLSSYCRSCHRKAGAKHNRTEYKAIRDWYREVKSTKSCMVCGENHPATLDFHHRNPADKVQDVTRMIVEKRARAAILAEIEKCDVLCSNCHRKLHYSMDVGLDKVG